MFLKNKITLLTTFLSFAAFGQSKLPPELLTKQAIQNIRFISDDGKVTYFQKDSGSLSLTTNYQTTEILKDTPFTQFLIHTTSEKKKVLVSAFFSFLDSQNFMRGPEVFVFDFLGKDSTKLGQGTNAKLHLKDDWVSFYQESNREIHFHKLSGSKTNFTIKIKNKINPYFVPSTILLNETTAILTDLDSKGHEILYRFDSLTGNFVQLYKSTHPGMRLELCKNKQQLIIGQFSIGDTANGSTIFTVDIDPQFALKKMDVVYSSNLNDLGHIICEGLDDEIYFIKAMTKESDINIKSTDVAKLNLNSKKIDTITQMGDATQLITLDSKIVVPYRGKLYVVKGENNSKTDDLINKKVEQPKESTEEEVKLEIEP